jgi:hypothetical protein
MQKILFVTSTDEFAVICSGAGPFILRGPRVTLCWIGFKNIGLGGLPEYTEGKSQACRRALMTGLILTLMMQVASTQFLVSTKAGLINYVKGSATVKAATVVKAGKPIGTGPDGAVEILLNPGSYLRMGASTWVVLDRVELNDIAAHVLQGSAVIEANGFDKKLPLKVTTGDLKMEIIKDGIYLFHDGKVVVIDGKIRDVSNGFTYGKGYQISDDQGYRVQKVKTFTTTLELWSQQRDALIAQANLNVSNSLRDRQNLPIASLLDIWLWYPAYGSFIYMPGQQYRSPYGYTYQTAQPLYYGTPGGGSTVSSQGNFSNAGTRGASGGAGGAPNSIIRNNPANTGFGGAPLGSSGVSSGGQASGFHAPAPTSAPTSNSGTTGRHY